MNLLSSKIHSLNNTFSSLLGQNSLLYQPAALKEHVSEGTGQHFGGHGLNFCVHPSNPLTCVDSSMRARLLSNMTQVALGIKPGFLSSKLSAF